MTYRWLVKLGFLPRFTVKEVQHGYMIYDHVYNGKNGGFWREPDGSSWIWPHVVHRITVKKWYKDKDIKNGGKSAAQRYATELNILHESCI